ncbi:hypothetical protein HW555_011112 [Spodoptera exigua]|uniref:Uncharacterized protein n=1 Tax=Spodoptera exigua TaxID=7107 RepID=A0A835G611_SPOEX|nr:hypothetical protein HW555_011112 [Spodoptera exigua]
MTGLLTLLAIDCKKIKIQIESDDLLKIFDGVINSETLTNFAQQLVQRGISKHRGVRNPYHPEDDLVNRFDTIVDKEQRSPGKRPFLIDLTNPHRGIQNVKRETEVPNHNVVVNKHTETTKDPLDQENELFLSGNEVANDDILTEIELPYIPLNDIEVKAKNDAIIEKDATIKQINKEIKNTSDTKQIILTRKDEHNKGLEFIDDRSNFKPIQKRFALKKSESTDLEASTSATQFVPFIRPYRSHLEPVNSCGPNWKQFALHQLAANKLHPIILHSILLRPFIRSLNVTVIVIR